MLPKERDTNVNEVIVDNDTNPDGKRIPNHITRNRPGRLLGPTGDDDGFIYDLPDFRDTENPFENGTYRQTTTIRSGKTIGSRLVCRHTRRGICRVRKLQVLPNSTEDARYTVNYSGGSKNSRSTRQWAAAWIYLGTFPLEAGYSDTEPVVTP